MMTRTDFINGGFAVAAIFCALMFISASDSHAFSGASSKGESSEVDCQANALCLLVPRFDGPAALGLSVATVLNMQIMQTLVRARNGVWLEAGAQILWSDQPLDEPGFSNAAARYTDCQRPPGGGSDAKEGCDMVFWGSTFPLGDEAVVMAYLSLIENNVPTWKVSIGGVDFHLELPAQKYSFKPFALSSQTVANYSGAGAIKLEDGRQLGASFKIIEWARSDRAKVKLLDEYGRQEGDIGFVELPNLSNRSDAVDFTAGVLRAYRADWCGVIEMMNRVIEEPMAQAQLVADAGWYMAWAKSETEVPCGGQALTRNDSTFGESPKMAQAGIFVELANISRQRSVPNLQALSVSIESYCKLPGSDHKWLQQLGQTLAQLNMDMNTTGDCFATVSNNS